MNNIIRLIIFIVMILAIGAIPRSNPSTGLPPGSVLAYPPPVQPTIQATNSFTPNVTIHLPHFTLPWSYLPVSAPLYSISYYVKSIDDMDMYTIGCEQGYRDYNLVNGIDTYVFLDFGQPWRVNNTFGTLIYSSPYSFHTNEEIFFAVWYYALGYTTCTGSSINSHITIGIGTNNDGSFTTYEHGYHWAQLILSANQAIQQFSSQISAAGASDMELGFNDPYDTIAWVDGFKDGVYDPVTGKSRSFLYNMGDAAGCPPYGDCGTEDYEEWTQDNVWYISWGCSSCRSMPEIYSNSGSLAQQWYNMSLYSRLTYGQQIFFNGTTTQYTACQQRSNDPTCTELDNTPEDGYKQLYTLLNLDPLTEQTSMYWSTDMKWWGE